MGVYITGFSVLGLSYGSSLENVLTVIGEPDNILYLRRPNSRDADGWEFFKEEEGTTYIMWLSICPEEEYVFGITLSFFETWYDS